MTVAELIEALEEFGDKHGHDRIVRLDTMDNIEHVLSLEEWNGFIDIVGDRDS